MGGNSYLSFTGRELSTAIDSHHSHPSSPRTENLNDHYYTELFLVPKSLYLKICLPTFYLITYVEN